MPKRRRDGAGRLPVIPVFIQGDAGRIFAIYHPPAAAAPDLGDLIFVPPFAEELNRSRHVVARQARALAARGCGVLILDLFGTGDSEGDFADCRWHIWRADVLAGAAWLRDRGRTRIGLWGLRLGSLLAMDVASRSDTPYSHILLWQPVLNGKLFLTQFLRIRVAAGMSKGVGGKLTTKELRETLRAGRMVEVAGYELAPDLAEAIDDLTMQPLGPASASGISWIEVVGDEQAGIAPGSSRLLEKWKSQNVSVEAKAIADPPFWSLMEPEWAPNLVVASTARVSGARS